MQLLYLLASLLASREVVANSPRNVWIEYATYSHLTESSRTDILIRPGILMPDHNAPQGNITLSDGTTFADGGFPDCWKDPVNPPVASSSPKYANGTCQVCVSQTLPGAFAFPTIGSRQDYHVRIRDNGNHDMGSVNQTLAAFGGETGGLNTVINMTVGGKQFHLWTMRDLQQPIWPSVYMSWGKPGPVDPFAEPSMLFSALQDNSSVGTHNCDYRGAPPDYNKVYFQCGFKC